MMRGVMVSVTRVKISPDLSVCTAYLSVFPSAKGEEIIKNVNENQKTIRYELGLDEDEIINAKMDKNEAKYPVEKAKGKNTKYDQL